MIKVLIVDDEKMVRKGIIGIMNWEKYNMTVVGEASNGRNALEFLKENPVDLVISDLTMPGLSGLAFISKLRALYPAVHIVISTIHQEFALIQEALQYDILDYITKSQIETDSDKILERIHQRVCQKASATEGEQPVTTLDGAIILYYLYDLAAQDVIRLSAVLGDRYTQLDRRLVMVDGSYEKEVISLLSESVMAFRRGDFENPCRDSFLNQLYDFMERDIFYLYRGEKGIFDVPKEGMTTPSLPTEASIEAIKTRLKGMQWVHSDMACQGIMDGLVRDRVPKQSVEAIFEALLIHWSDYMDINLMNQVERVKSIHFWYEWEGFIKALRARFVEKEQVEHTGLGGSAMVDMAIAYITKHYREDIALEAVITMLHVSKSHFSYMFKKETGKTFKAYIRSYRVEKAKKMLLKTDDHVYFIGQKVGYGNEKYFRKVFKDETGLKPNQFRKQYRD